MASCELKASCELTFFYKAADQQPHQMYFYSRLKSTRIVKTIILRVVAETIKLHCCL